MTRPTVDSTPTRGTALRGTVASVRCLATQNVGRSSQVTWHTIKNARHPPPSLVSASCILTTPLDVADDQSGTLQSRAYTCMERASEDHIQHATCPNHELLEIASKCCEDKISKCGAGASGCCYEYKEDVNTGHSESYCNTESKEIVTQNDCPGEYAIHMPVGFLSFARSSFLSTRECMHG